MPGFILHIAAAQMLMEKWDALATMDSDNRSAFQVGNLIPDSVSDKTFSHFRHPDRNKKLIVYPDLDLFLTKYSHLLSDSSCLGYYFHLFIDRVYAMDYLPQILTFYNADGLEASDRKDITHALIKRTGELVPVKTIFSDAYYYGDFTKMNTYLMNHFSLSTVLKCDVENPGIEEVNYADIQTIQEQLNGYLDVEENAIYELKVFDIQDLLRFLEQSVEKFLSLIK